MKIKSIVLASLLSALFVTSAVASELKVGYVNTQRIFRDAPAAQKAAKKLEGEFAKRDQDLQRMAKQMQGLQENLEKNSVTLRQNEENAAVIEKANRAIKQIAEAEKYDLILQDVVWVSPRLDITERVIKALSESK